jgi:hypothetical protein
LTSNFILTFSESVFISIVNRPNVVPRVERHVYHPTFYQAGTKTNPAHDHVGFVSCKR